jgi:ribonuclease VapC
MFVDASAIVAIMTTEADARELAAKLDLSPLSITSPIAVYEATLAYARLRSLPAPAAAAAVDEFLSTMRIELNAIPPEAAALALSAFARYGKGQGNPAQLSMGDCFAYGCARHFDVPLLCKGDDFSFTDVETA